MRVVGGAVKRLSYTVDARNQHSGANIAGIATTSPATARAFVSAGNGSSRNLSACVDWNISTIPRTVPKSPPAPFCR